MLEYTRSYAEASGSDLHTNVPLSNYAVRAFRSGQEGLIADQVMPAVPVGKQSDFYYRIDKGAFLSTNTTIRAPGTPARRVTFDISSATYFAHNYALAGEHPLEDIANADQQVMLQQNMVDLITSQLRLDQEQRIANLVTSGSNVGSGVTLGAADRWSNANSDPIGTVNTGMAYMQNATGLIPNTMVMGWNTFQVVRRHPALIDLQKYTTAGELNMQQLADAFSVSRILIGSAIRQTAAEGATAAFSTVWGSNVLLAHVGQVTGLRSQTFGLRFSWRPPVFPADFGVATNREDAAGERKVEVIEAGYYQDERIVAPELGYVIGGAIA